MTLLPIREDVVAGLLEGGDPVVIPNSEGSRTTPSTSGWTCGPPWRSCRRASGWP